MAVTDGVGSMNQTEVQDFLKDSRCGVLSLIDGDKPYSIPVEHYFDGKSLYFLTSEKEGQRKINCIKNNTNACYIIYDSRREKPEIVKKGIHCRSVLIEGPISIAGTKEIDTNEMEKVKVRILKLDVNEMGNWRCPAQTCDWQNAWFEKFPDLLADL